MQPCSHATLQPCSHAAVQPCSRAAMQPCSLAALQPCSHAAMQPCSHAAMQPCSHAAMHLYSHAALQPCSLAALQPCLTALQHQSAAWQPQESFTALWCCGPKENLRYQNSLTAQPPTKSLNILIQKLCSYSIACACTTGAKVQASPTSEVCLALLHLVWQGQRVRLAMMLCHWPCTTR